MAVLPVKTEPRCKLCSSPERPAIDALLEMRSRGKSDERGARVNLEYVLRVLGEWGVTNPTEDNVKNHWKKHCQLVDDADAEKIGQEETKLTQARLESWERIFGEDWMDTTPTPEQILEYQRTEYVFGQFARVAAGQDTGITHDQADRAMNTQTRRSAEEQAASLVTLLAGAVGEAHVIQAKALAAVAEGKTVEGDADEVVEDAELVPAGELEPGE